MSRQPTLGDLLRERRRSQPSATAVVDGQLRLTWVELDDRVDRLATGLAALGVGTGDRILWLGQNSARILELLFAASRLGALVCPANWRSSAEELAFVLDDLQPALVIWQEREIGDMVRAARAAHTGRARWVRHDGAGADDEYERLLSVAAGADPDEPGDGAGAVLLIYTAAWSGRPAAAMLTHTAIATQGLLLGALADVDAGYRYLNSGPLFHLGTLMFTFATFVAGGTNVFTPRMDAEAVCRLVEAERCTGAFIVGPTIEEILELNSGGRFDLRSLRWPPGRSEWDAMVTPDTSAWARHPGGYGQTELTGMLTYAALGAGGIGSHGRPAPLSELRVVGPDGADLADGEVGEILARGPTAMVGYWNRPVENERRHLGDWLRTNDLGRREADGTLTFVGPRTRMIKSAAENIYPAEVEAVLARHPAVSECAIIGVPDPRWVQNVRAIVVRREGADATERELIEHCRAHLASYKKPRSVVFTDRLPRQGFAVDYDVLDATYGGGGYPGGTTRSV